MSTVLKGMLFGGAIFAAGLGAENAAAGVHGVQFTLDGYLKGDYFLRDYDSPDPYDYISTGNQSFFAQGGRELAPFEQIGRSGAPPGVGSFSSGFVRVRVDAADGGVGGDFFTSFGVSSSSSPAYLGDGNSDSRGYARLDFTVLSAEQFTLDGQGSLSGDIGSWRVLLTDALGAVIFQDFDGTPNDGRSFSTSGVLGPGDYSLVLRSFANDNGIGGSGSVGVDFAVTPTPGSAGALGVLGLVAMRRRRTAGTGIHLEHG